MPDVDRLDHAATLQPEYTFRHETRCRVPLRSHTAVATCPCARAAVRATPVSATPSTSLPKGEDDGVLRECLDAIRRRDRAALGRLYDLTVSRVYGTALPIVRRAEPAEEAVSMSTCRYGAMSRATTTAGAGCWGGCLSLPEHAPWTRCAGRTKRSATRTPGNSPMSPTPAATIRMTCFRRPRATRRRQHAGLAQMNQVLN